MTSDADLLRRFTEQSSQAAFAELVARHVDFVYAAARRQTGSDHRAQDVVQLVFTDLARKACSPSVRNNVVGWLFVSTRYAAGKIARAEARRDFYEREAAMEQELTRSSDAELPWDQLKPQLDSALNALGDADRTAILLRVFKGYSFGEVGAVLRTSEEAARKRVDRALEKLRLVLARRGITSTVAALAAGLPANAALSAPAGLAAHVASTALADAAMTAAAGGIAGFVQLMTTTKIIVGAGAIAVMLSVGSALHEIRLEKQSDEMRIAAAMAAQAEVDRLAVLKRQVEDAERAAQDAEKRRAEPEAQTRNPAPEKSPGVVRPVSPGRADLLAQLARGAEFLAAHPEAKEWLRVRWRADREGFTSLFYKSLELTPEQVPLVEHFLMWDGNTFLTLPSGEIVGLPLIEDSGDPAASRSRWEGLKAVLGEEKLGRFRNAFAECQVQNTARQITAQVASSVYFTDTPLTIAQGDALTSIIRSSFAAGKDGRASFRFDTFDWPKALTAAQGILSTSQLDAFELMKFRLERSKEYVAARDKAVMAANAGGAK